jgi:hypothetical protein
MMAVLCALLAAGGGPDDPWRLGAPVLSERERVEGALPAGLAQEVVIDEPEPGIVLAALGRLSAPSGTLDHDVPVDYDEVFGSGAGIGVEMAFLFRTMPHWRMGPYASLLWEHFDGRKDTDPFGDSLEPDGLDLTTLMGGFKAQLLFAHGFHADFHVALGLSRNETVDGVLTVNAVRQDVEVFADSTRLAFDFGARMGFSRRHLFVELGFGVRSQGAPEDADIAFSSDPLTTVALELAVGLKF